MLYFPFQDARLLSSMGYLGYSANTPGHYQCPYTICIYYENLTFRITIWQVKRNFSPGPGFKLGSPALRAGAITPPEGNRDIIREEF